MNTKVEWFKEIEDEFSEIMINLQNDVKCGHYHKVHVIESYELAKEFLGNRYNFYYNHYNKNIHKMDNFVYQNIVTEMRVFANVTYNMIASKYDDDTLKLNIIKNSLNNIVNELAECEIK